MVDILKKYFFLILFFITIFVFYRPFILEGELPIPTDTIVGLYHPYRDLLAGEYPNGYPFKNFLITDPVRQTFIWKELAVSQLKKGVLPIWNPYEMTGKPLIGNFQSGAFYPLNVLLFAKPFYLSWSIYIMIQSFLGGIFMYIFLRNLNLDKRAVILGSLSFTFSGFFISWLQWGNVVQTAIWLPIILFSIDKICKYKVNKDLYIFSLLLLLSLVSSFLAGHLQVFFYTFLVGLFYFAANIQVSSKKFGKKIISFGLVLLAFILITIVQWVPTLKFVNQSARSIDQNYLTSEGFFLPIHHLIQIVAPDFFGNVTTLNYWGTWNYGELVLYIGIIPLIFAISSFFIKSRKKYFFIILMFVSLLFAVPNLISKLPFVLNIPLLSTSQPTRLIFLATFSLSVLAAYGFDEFINNRSKKNILISSSVVLLFIIFLWIFVVLGNTNFFGNESNISVATRNLIIPTGIFASASALLIFCIVSKNKRIVNFILIFFILLTGADLLRFASKFNVFASSEFLYPETKIINYLKNDKELFRISSVDDRILPPNFSTYYRLQSIEGYDPLYLKSYAQFIAAMERDKPDISEPFGFNRIITPSNYKSSLYDFLNVKYILSLNDIKSDKLKLIMEEGQTKLYKNLNVLSRVYFVENIITSKSGKETINLIMKSNLKNTAIVSNDLPNGINNKFSVGIANIVLYEENKVIIKTSNEGLGFLVFSDSFYPTWRVKIDGVENKIYIINLSFRGIIVPPGNHEIIFYTEYF